MGTSAGASGCHRCMTRILLVALQGMFCHSPMSTLGGQNHWMRPVPLPHLGSAVDAVPLPQREQLDDGVAQRELPGGAVPAPPPPRLARVVAAGGPLDADADTLQGLRAGFLTLADRASCQATKHWSWCAQRLKCGLAGLKAAASMHKDSARGTAHSRGQTLVPSAVVSDRENCNEFLQSKPLSRMNSMPVCALRRRC